MGRRPNPNDFRPLRPVFYRPKTTKILTPEEAAREAAEKVARAELAQADQEARDAAIASLLALGSAHKGHGWAEPSGWEPQTLVEAWHKQDLLPRLLAEAEGSPRLNARRVAERRARSRRQHVLLLVNDSIFEGASACDFVPRAIRVRDQHWARQFTHHTVTYYWVSVGQFLRWATVNAWVPPDTHQKFEAAPRICRPRAKAGKKIVAVEEAQILATVAAMRAADDHWLADLVLFHWLTGCRAVEAMQARWSEIADRDQPTWTWNVEEHRTRRRTGEPRVVKLGPRAQEVLKRREQDPVRSETHIFVYKQTWPGTAWQKILPCVDYQYSRRVTVYCSWAGLPIWQPRQIRHARATFVERRHGREAEAASVGHEARVAAQLYIERNLELAAAVALADG